MSDWSDLSAPSDNQKKAKSMNFIALSADTPGIIRDENGVPVEWIIFKAGDTPYCQNGTDGVITLTEDDLRKIIIYFNKKGELIPIDSEHYLYALANKKNLDESETLRLFPDGVAALGFGALSLDRDGLHIKVKWNPAAYEMLKEKIYKYFSPVLRGIADGPLRLTSIAMTNTPAINNLDALAASAINPPEPLAAGKTRKGSNMTKLEKALLRLTGRDSIALESEGDELAAAVEEKASLIEQVKKLLDLDVSATLDEVIAALKAETEKAAAADEKQAELDRLADASEKQAHAALVEKGRQERKIVDADMDYVNSLDSKALSAYLDHAAPKFPAPLANKPERKKDEAALTAEDHRAISALKRAGIADAEKQYLNHRKGE